MNLNQQLPQWLNQAGLQKMPHDEGDFLKKIELIYRCSLIIKKAISALIYSQLGSVGTAMD